MTEPHEQGARVGKVPSTATACQDTFGTASAGQLFSAGFPRAVAWPACRRLLPIRQWSFAGGVSALALEEPQARQEQGQ